MCVIYEQQLFELVILLKIINSMTIIEVAEAWQNSTHHIEHTFNLTSYLLKNKEYVDNYIYTHIYIYICIYIYINTYMHAYTHSVASCT